MIYCFDIDGTICSTVKNSEYHLALPDQIVIDEINKLHSNGHYIKIMTARGCVSGIDYTELTLNQLSEWNLKYDELIMNKKPHANIFIDDRAINIEQWKKGLPTIRGVIAGAFDLIHPGYIKMFKEAKASCNHLTIALHSDPSKERGKPVPIHSVSERLEILKSIKYIDDVIVYDTEKDLMKILSSGMYDLRFLGSDYKVDKYTGPEIDIKIVWIERNHSYSTTRLKSLIGSS